MTLPPMTTWEIFLKAALVMVCVASGAILFVKGVRLDALGNRRTQSDGGLELYCGGVCLILGVFSGLMLYTDLSR